MLDDKNIEKRINPFFESYNTPHNTVPFHRIKLEDYEEAFMEGIRRDDEATDKLINDPAEPTFENTIARVDTEKGEHYYDLLSRLPEKWLEKKEPRNMPTTTQAAMMIGINRLFLFLFIFMFYTNVISTICSCLYSVREAYSFASA
jgi:hypothetical protein